MRNNDERYRALRIQLGKAAWKQVPLGYTSPVYDSHGGERQYRVEMFCKVGKQMLVITSAWWMEPSEECCDLTVSTEVFTGTIEEIAALTTS